MPANSVQHPLAAAPAATEQLNGDAIFAAFNDPVRHRIIRELHDGSVLSVRQVAARLKRSADSIAKQLRVLREARMVMSVPSPDGDGRKQCYQIPEAFRARDAAGRAAVDFGSVVVRLE